VSIDEVRVANDGRDELDEDLVAVAKRNRIMNLFR